MNIFIVSLNYEYYAEYPNYDSVAIYMLPMTLQMVSEILEIIC